MASRFIMSYHYATAFGPSSDQITWYGNQAVSDVIMGAVTGTLSSLSEVIQENTDPSTIPDGTRRTGIALMATATNSLQKFSVRNLFDGVDEDSLYEGLFMGTAVTFGDITLTALGSPPLHHLTGDPFTRVADASNVLKT